MASEPSAEHLGDPSCADAARTPPGHNASKPAPEDPLRRRCLALVAAALAAAGCGSANKKAPHSTVTTPAPSTAASATPTECNTLGINPTGMREGTCSHAGITYVIVDQNHTLKLHTLTASLASLRTVSAMTGGAQPATAGGKFIVASIRLTNRLELPQSFDKGGTQQAAVNLGGTVYPEDVSVERSADPNSCVAAKISIALGKSVICQVVFDVPGGAVADLGKRGGGDLYLVDFGSGLNESVSPQTVGQIRLYR